MPKTSSDRKTQNLSARTCADCGMPILRSLRNCGSCGRPLPQRQSMVRSTWALLTFWLTVMVVIYGLVGILRFVAPITLRVTCTAQVVPPRLLLVPTATYTELLSSGDCSAPRGSVVLLTTVPDWLVAAAIRDQKTWAGQLYHSGEEITAPIRLFIPANERAIQTTLNSAWQSAITDLCAPTWIARWCMVR